MRAGSDWQSDPDVLVGAGVSKVVTADGLLIVSLLLSVTHTPASSWLWLLLLIPAFYLFGQGFSDVFRARQIRRRAKRASAPLANELPPAQVSVVDIVTEVTTRDLVVAPNVRTTGPQHS